MLNVMQAFNVPTRYKTRGDLGIEIEVEGASLPRTAQYWRMEVDPSLRGESIEYVLRNPMTLPEVKDALDYLEEAYQSSNTVVNDSVRAGVHVHVNVQNLTTVQLFNFISAYVIMEDVLIKYCGKYREGNLFCLRIKDADYLAHCLEQVATTKNYGEFHTDMLRYAAMNVKALGQYGSLEFRAMRGTRDLDVIYKWASMLLNIRNVCVNYNNPTEIVNLLDEYGCESFLERFLGVNYKELIDYPNLRESITQGLMRASNLIYNTDWNSFETIDIGGIHFPVGTKYPNEPLEDF